MSFSSQFTIVAAHHNGVIGSGSALPWIKKIPSDLKRFKNLTIGGVVIVGRKTYETLPPLEGREVVVLSKEHEYIGSHIAFSNFRDALIFASSTDKPIFVIGGGQIYAEAIKHPSCRWIELTEIEGREEYFDMSEDLTYFPDIPSHFKIVSENVHAERYSSDVHTDTEAEQVPYKVTRRRYKSAFDTESQEVSYLNLLCDVIIKGDLKENRTGVNTLSLFGKTLAFGFEPRGDGYYTFPLLTTKKMF
jgi:dihydrofolate reductase